MTSSVITSINDGFRQRCELSFMCARKKQPGRKSWLMGRITSGRVRLIRDHATPVDIVQRFLKVVQFLSCPKSTSIHFADCCLFRACMNRLSLQNVFSFWVRIAAYRGLPFVLVLGACVQVWLALAAVDGRVAHAAVVGRHVHLGAHAAAGELRVGRRLHAAPPPQVLLHRWTAARHTQHRHQTHSL